MSTDRPFVVIVDDDESVRESLPGLLAILGFESAAFASAESFLASDALQAADCLILDIAMPGMSGPELMLHPAVRNHGAPVIVITAMQSGSIRREMLELGAVELLFKPFGEAALIAALAEAIPDGPPRIDT
jgi:FixJ family two-component response regulator